MTKTPRWHFRYVKSQLEADEKIFTADEPEVEALPRDKIVNFLSANSSTACVGYLEHVIDDLGDESPDFHDKLAELYLDDVKEKSKSKDKGECEMPWTS